ncbi:MAG TPA: zinc ABC transporter substrate-binding protein, partial [candidate division Zixibacteria bacterium]|nr:zinc ABC transporter substrate-binding protein [candidate division Zixibacteria bacterium]
MKRNCISFQLHKARLTLVLLILSAAIFSLAACSGKAKNSSGKLRIVATIGMITNAVKVIAGDSVEITGLMGPGVDPHLYKATKGDIDLLDNADLILYNGLNLEAKMTEIFEKMTRIKPTVAVAEGIDTALLRQPPEFQGHPDPHVWFDVSMWKTAVEAVGEALIKNDTVHKDFYQANLSAYLDSLETLHNWVKLEMQSIPVNYRVLVTAHDAFGYFGRAYEIEVKGLQGISTVTEAGLYDVTHMIDILVERKIKAVFVETSVPRKAIDAVVEGCRAKGHNVQIGGLLFSDAMGE